jgi:hypothetical protein
MLDQDRRGSELLELRKLQQNINGNPCKVSSQFKIVGMVGRRI